MLHGAATKKGGRGEGEVNLFPNLFVSKDLRPFPSLVPETSVLTVDQCLLFKGSRIIPISLGTPSLPDSALGLIG